MNTVRGIGRGLGLRNILRVQLAIGAGIFRRSFPRASSTVNFRGSTHELLQKLLARYVAELGWRREEGRVREDGKDERDTGNRAYSDTGLTGQAQRKSTTHLAYSRCEEAKKKARKERRIGSKEGVKMKERKEWPVNVTDQAIAEFYSFRVVAQVDHSFQLARINLGLTVTGVNHQK